MKRSIFIAAASILLAACDGGQQAEEAVSNNVAEPINTAQVAEIIQVRCATCHAESPTDDIFKTAPGGVYLETIEQMQRYAARIQARAIATQSMPFMNKTQMTEKERALIAEWIKAGTPSD